MKTTKPAGVRGCILVVSSNSPVGALPRYSLPSGLIPFLPCLAVLLLLFSGGFATVSPAATGPITIATDYPHSLRYQSGERFFPMGDTAYFLIAQPTNIIAYYIDVRRAHKFNFIRMMSMSDGFWPFGGTQSSPNYTTINETAMQKWDWVFNYAASKGMNIELIIFGYGIGGGEGLWTNTVNQNLWIDTLVNRYKNRPNLLMYTIANEFERYSDGVYAYEANDVEWAKGVAARIRTMDTVHPIGAHPSVWITDDNPFRTYNGFTQRRPQVVWPLWENGQLNLNVTQNNEGVQPRKWSGGLTYYPTNWQGVYFPVSWVTNASGIGWDFEAAGMEDCIAEDWSHGKPILNTEFGYQYETNPWSYGFNTRQSHLPSTVRKKAWKIVTAGGYFAAGYLNLAVTDIISTNIVDNFRPQQIETLYDFFTTKTEYWKLAPHLELVASHNVLLALPGREYVAYFPQGGTNSINLAAGVYSVEWLRPETGEYIPQSDITVASGNADFIPPNTPTADWVLHLQGLDDTLVGHWSFDEGSGTTTADQSGNGNDGTLLSATIPLGWSNSPYGAYCLDFEGRTVNASNRVLVASNSASLELTGAMTVSAWVKRRSLTNHGRILTKACNANPATAGFSLNEEGWWGDYDGQWAFQIASDLTTVVSVNVTNPGAAYSNQWVHLAGVYDPSVPSMRIYTNGVLGAEKLTDVPLSQYNNVSNRVYMGASGTPYGTFAEFNWFNGQIDDVRVYNRVLSGGEIATLAGGSAVALDPSYPLNATTAPCPSGQTFAVQVSAGSLPLRYQWFDSSSGTPIAGETNTTLALSAPLASGSFYCVVSNSVNSATSRVAVLTVTNDTMLPVLVSASATGGTQVRVVFSKTVSAPTAQNANNYTLSSPLGGVSVSGAVLQGDGKTVDLTIASPLVEGALYTLTVSDVQDVACPANTIVANSPATFPYNNGLVGYWNFEEGSGTSTTDQSGNGSHGTLLSRTIPIGWSNSPFGAYCLDFEGRTVNASNRVLIASNSAALELTGAMTLSAWVKRRSLTNHGRIVNKASGANPTTSGFSLNEEGFSGNYSGQWSFQIASNLTTTLWINVTNPGAAYSNQWAHLAGVYDPSGPSMRIYTNGVLGAEKLTGVPAQQYNNVANRVYIGAKGTPYGTFNQFNWFNGQIDEVRIYNRALSSNEIAALAVVPPPQFGSPTISSGSINLNWTGGGQLQWAPAVLGPWTEVTPTPIWSYYSEPIVLGTNRFFRLFRTNGIP